MKEEEEEIPIRIEVPKEDKGGMIPFPVEVEPQGPRRVYILPRDIDKYGASKGCAGCQHKCAGMKATNHSTDCRKRMEESIAEDPEEAHRTKRAKMRETEDIIKKQDAEDNLRWRMEWMNQKWFALRINSGRGKCVIDLWEPKLDNDRCGHPNNNHFL